MQPNIWQVHGVCNHHLALNNSVNMILRKIPHLIAFNFHASTDNKIFTSHETRSLYFPFFLFFFSYYWTTSKQLHCTQKHFQIYSKLKCANYFLYLLFACTLQLEAVYLCSSSSGFEQSPRNNNKSD